MLTVESLKSFDIEAKVAKIDILCNRRESNTNLHLGRVES